MWYLVTKENEKEMQKTVTEAGFWQWIVEKYTNIDERMAKLRSEVQDMKMDIEDIKTAIVGMAAEKGMLESAFIRTFTIEPDTLNSFLEMVRRIDEEIKNSTMYPHYQMAVSCAASSTTQAPLALPVGWLCTRRSALDIAATYHSSDIDVNIYIDDNIVAGCPLDLSTDIHFDFRDEYIKEREVLIETINNTTTDFVETLIVTPALSTKNFYNKFFVPLLKLTLNDLKRTAGLI